LSRDTKTLERQATDPFTFEEVKSCLNVLHTMTSHSSSLSRLHNKYTTERSERYNITAQMNQQSIDLHIFS